MRVSVIVPTYDEVDNIESVCRGIRAALPMATIVVIDDSSPDGTADAVRSIAPEIGDVLLIERDGKQGLGSAYRFGFRQAIETGAEICVQMDADNSHDPAMLRALVANVELGADLAIGSRYVPGGRTVDWPRRRQALSRWGNRYAAGVLGLAVNDATAGFRAYSAAALEQMDFESVRADGYGFQVEMTHRLIRAEGKIVEFPITFRERTAGRSKMSGHIVREAAGLVARLWVADLRGRRERRRHGG